jgi:hypothetical protein
MKKVILGVFVLMMAVSLTGCGKTETGIEGDSTSRITTKKVKEVVKNAEKFAGIPIWAKGIKAVEPQGLEVIPGSFSTNEDDDGKNTRQSFEIKYRGSVEELFKQAKSMTTAMGAKVDFEDETEFLGSGILNDSYVVTVSVKTDTKNKYVDEPFLYYSVKKKYSPKN